MSGPGVEQLDIAIPDARIAMAVSFAETDTRGQKESTTDIIETSEVEDPFSLHKLVRQKSRGKLDKKKGWLKKFLIGLACAVGVGGIVGLILYFILR